MWRTLDESPVWRTVPQTIRTAFEAPLPERGYGLEGALHKLRHDVLPFPRGNVHPRFWGWVNGSGIPAAALADFVAGAVNSTVTSSESSAMYVERQVLAWIKEILGWETCGDGLLTSGCSMGHIIALAAARRAAYGARVRDLGMGPQDRGRVYVSSEAHLSLEKAVELLGIGSANLVRVEVDEDKRIRCDCLRDAIISDREKGMVPICVVGNIGTVNTGAIDDIDGLLSISRNLGVWLHLDAAFGAFGRLISPVQDKLVNLGKADSIALDLHKWFYMPFDVSCILTRDPEILLSTFEVKSGYMSPLPAGPASFPHSFGDRGVEQTRSMRALKVWFALTAYGVEAFRKSITKNYFEASFLARLIKRNPGFELLSRGDLNIVCFRLFDGSMSESEINQLNIRALTVLQLSGKALPSHTWLDGKFAIRVAINNHRTKFYDIEILVRELVEIRTKILSEFQASSGA
ncbi:pyridoxal-dependent decarboxylase [Acetobacter sicerae]|uniref:Pyridoxal-dependent decarboxylase n=2 Tax=Acetobacter TaxID=434 RepID=A0ABS8VUP6_9PROT|nr:MULTISPECIES: pyridoxal-dependent decarboxylase [Acetobacter]MBC9008944.1 amino acid decarboxylase [Acetobacter tropicalis]MCE0743891.1 pyridoxal-dependent decarboxylase [Acetobacter sicerae]